MVDPFMRGQKNTKGSTNLDDISNNSKSFDN
jgi:hypothetical protein